MLRFSTSKLVVFLLLCLFNWQGPTLFAQKISSGNEGPSICDCVKYSKSDPQLLSRCEQKFDYDAMSSYERIDVENAIYACAHPEICDCANLGANDTIIAQACLETYNTDSLDEKEYENYLEEKKECIQRSNKPPLKTICECLEPHTEDDIDYDHCKGIWDITSLSKEERQKFVAEVSGCMNNTDNPNYTLSLCDCLNAPGQDMAFKERCIQKFDMNNMSDDQILAYKEETKDCSIYQRGGNDIEIICDCIKEERDTGKMSSRCEDVLQNLEEKYKNRSPEEMQELVQKLMDCLGTFK